MKAKQCDRCMAFYVPDEEPKVTVRKKAETKSRYTKSLDLCKNCQKDLIAWLKKPPK
jgi:methionyl-tRNA synthetase